MTCAGKLLIVSKDLESRGGVANYYRLLLEKSFRESIPIAHTAIGSRSTDYYCKGKWTIPYMRLYVNDILRFITALSKDRGIGIVMLNPSLIPVPLLRDGILLLLSKLLNRKVIFFIRGWDLEYANTLGGKRVLRTIIACLVSRSDRILVLANKFKNRLCEWGVPEELILITRTMFDGDLVNRRYDRTGAVIRFLFLSRISESKGIREIIEAAAFLRREGYDFELTFVGFGKDEDSVVRLKAFATEQGVAEKATFKGFLDGQKKYDEYATADVFLLPSYSEGCPNSVLEAMASGLFIICTPVGALSEVVQDCVNGRIVKARDAGDLADKMRWAIENVEEVRRLGRLNVGYAFQNFEAGVIIEQMKEIYREILSN